MTLVNHFYATNSFSFNRVYSPELHVVGPNIERLWITGTGFIQRLPVPSSNQPCRSTEGKLSIIVYMKWNSSEYGT